MEEDWGLVNSFFSSFFRVSDITDINDITNGAKIMIGVVSETVLTLHSTPYMGVVNEWVFRTQPEIKVRILRLISES